MANILNPELDYGPPKPGLNPVIAPKSIQSYASSNVNALDMAIAQGTAGVSGISGQSNSGTIGTILKTAGPALGTAIGGPIGTLIGLALSIYGQSKVNRQSVDMANQQMQWNEQMMDKQNQQQLDFWNMQNEYNSPAAQVQRMHEAGLYAGGVESSQAQSMNAASALGYQNPNLQNPLAGLGDVVLKLAQIKNLEADAANKNASAKTEDELREERKDNIVADTNRKRQEIKNLGLDADKQEILNRYLDQKEQTEIATMNKSIELSDAQISRINKEIEKYDKEIEVMNARIDEILSLTALNLQKINESIALVNEYNALIGKIATETSLNNLDITYYVSNHDKPGVFGTGISFSNLTSRFILGDLDNKVGSVLNLLSDESVIGLFKPMFDKKKSANGSISGSRSAYGAAGYEDLN